MSQAAAAIDRASRDPRSRIAPAQAAALREACAAAAATHSALELGVVARVSEARADPAAVAADCGLTQQGAEALLSALAGLDLLELGDDGRFRPATGRQGRDRRLSSHRSAGTGHGRRSSTPSTSC